MPRDGSEQRHRVAGRTRWLNGGQDRAAMRAARGVRRSDRDRARKLRGDYGRATDGRALNPADALLGRPRLLLAQLPGDRRATCSVGWPVHDAGGGTRGVPPLRPARRLSERQRRRHARCERHAEHGVRVGARRNFTTGVHDHEPRDAHADARETLGRERLRPLSRSERRRDGHPSRRGKPGDIRVRDGRGPRPHHGVRVPRRRLALRAAVESVRGAVRAAGQLRFRRAGDERRV